MGRAACSGDAGAGCDQGAARRVASEVAARSCRPRGAAPRLVDGQCPRVARVADRLRRPPAGSPSTLRQAHASALDPCGDLRAIGGRASDPDEPWVAAQRWPLRHRVRRWRVHPDGGGREPVRWLPTGHSWRSWPDGPRGSSAVRRPRRPPSGRPGGPRPALRTARHPGRRLRGRGAGAEESWSLGAPSGLMAPGTMSALGSVLREPSGRISWAATDTATEWTGVHGGRGPGRSSAPPPRRWPDSLAKVRVRSRASRSRGRPASRGW